MFHTFKQAWKTADMRKKLIFTLLVIVVFRIGNAITVPFVNLDLFKETMSAYSSSVYGLLNLMSGGAFAAATIFALGVQPYINAAIIIQLVTGVIPPLREMAEQGEEGKKKLKRVTVISSGVVGIVQAIGYYMMMRRYQVLSPTGLHFWAAALIVLIITAGALFLAWLGEKVEKNGVGNGISIVLLAGILSRIPSMLGNLIRKVQIWFQLHGTTIKASDGTEVTVDYSGVAITPWVAAIILLIMLAVIVLIVLFNGAERRVPVYHAGRRQGMHAVRGGSNCIPVKPAMSGVLPIIFAQSLMAIPMTIFTFTGIPKKGFGAFIYNGVHNQSIVYMVIYAVLIFAFSYFYAFVQFDPIEVAKNMKQSGAMIPGFRPGRPTSALLLTVLKSVTLVGAIYLTVIAMTPIVIGKLLDSTTFGLSGTSIIIIVGVILETLRQLDAKMTAYSYKGFVK